MKINKIQNRSNNTERINQQLVCMHFPAWCFPTNNSDLGKQTVPVEN